MIFSGRLNRFSLSKDQARIGRGLGELIMVEIFLAFCESSGQILNQN